MDGKNIWYSNLKISKSAYKKLQKIERDLGVVIIRYMRGSFFRAYGPEDRLPQAAEALQQLIDELKAECSVMSTTCLVSEGEAKVLSGGCYKECPSRL